jgi:hypothetical protein
MLYGLSCFLQLTSVDLVARLMQWATTKVIHSKAHDDEQWLHGHVLL